MHLEIKQNINKTEIVDPSVISKLYELSYEDQQNGTVSQLDSTSDVQGRIETVAADEDEVRYLAGIDPGDVKRFQNLYITVPNNSYYINIEDPATKAICVALWGGADGGTAAASSRVNNTKIPGAAGELTYAQAASIKYFPSNAFTNNTSIIDASVFQYFTNLTNFSENAFLNCSSLKNLTIPANFTAFQNNSFYGCSLLTRVDALKDLEGWMRITTQNIYSTPLTRPVSLYLNGVELAGEVVIPNSITDIKSCTFWNLRAITSVVFHNGITSIGGYAFAGTSIAGNLTLPQQLIILGERSFYGCTNITRVTIQNGLSIIGKDAFRDCTSLTRIDIPASVITIGSGAFAKNGDSYDIYYSGTLQQWMNIDKQYHIDVGGPFNNNILYIQDVVITDVVVPAGTTIIKQYALTNSVNITSITLPDSLLSIGLGAFRNTRITSITIPNSVTSIGADAFRDCINLRSIVMPDSLTEIQSYAFAGCITLTSVTIPNSVTSIGNYVFSQCSNLETVIVEAVTPPTLGNNVFYYNKSNRIIYVPDASVDVYKSANGWSSYKNYIKGISELPQS